MDEIKGYHALSKVMSLDSGFLIFRRFADLNARNLLYLQAELTYLEQELLDLAREDHEADETRKRYELSALEMMLGDGEQWHAVLAIREKLKEYSMEN